MEEELGGGVVELVGRERADDREFVGDAGEVRKEFGNLGAAAAVLFEGVARRGDGRVAAEEGEALALDEVVRGRFAVEAGEGGFVIE